MESLNCTDNIIYHPEYDINTGEYVDQCPIPPRKTRNYICHCFGGLNNGLFKNKTEYSYHVKLKCHRNYISNYADRINDLIAAKDYIKNILKRNKELEKENAALKFQLSQVNKQSFQDAMVELD